MDVEFVRDEHSGKEQGEFRNALKMIAKTQRCPYTYTDMIAQWAHFQTSLGIASNGLLTYTYTFMTSVDARVSTGRQPAANSSRDSSTESELRQISEI